MASRAFKNIDLKKASDIGSLGNINVFQRSGNFIKRKVMLLNYEMRKERFFRLPLFTSRSGSNTIPYSISSLCGHVSFMIFGASYLQTDFLNLRLYAVSGLSFAIIFQSFREKPLMVAIRWNSALLAVNIFMLFNLWQEHLEAKSITDEERDIYLRMFAKYEMSLVDFHKVLKCAERKEIDAGESLIKEEEMNDNLYLIQEGDVSVEKSTEKVAEYRSGQFVGVMSFLAWSDDGRQKKKRQTQIKELYDRWNSDSDVDGYGHGSEYEYMDFLSALRRIGKTLLSNTIEGESKMENQDENDYGNQSGDEPLRETAVVNVRSGDGSPNSGGGDLYIYGGAAGKVAKGQANVSCKTNCVVYVWKFEKLHKLLLYNPKLARSFQNSLSSDLNKKITNSWTSMKSATPLLVYKEVLSALISHRKINGVERNYLATYRMNNDISHAEHLKVLEELGITEDDFLKRKKKGSSSSISSRDKGKEELYIDTDIEDKSK